MPVKRSSVAQQQEVVRNLGIPLTDEHAATSHYRIKNAARADPLPHVICCSPDGLAGAEHRDEAKQHLISNDRQPIESGAGTAVHSGWQRRSTGHASFSG